MSSWLQSLLGRGSDASSEDRPNLFQFATSELSQDAFICWLISHAGCPSDSELQRCAEEFVLLLLRLANPALDFDSPPRIKLIRPPVRQYYKTDIYFQAEINGRRLSFVIEDKTYTSHHSNQLERYKDSVLADDIPEDDLVLVYFKTGYLFDEDLDASASGYAVLGLEQLHDFLQSHDISNDIFRDYRDHIRALWESQSGSLSSLGTSDGHLHLGQPFVQWEFMKRLKTTCPGHVSSSWLSRGTNRGGNPWTHFGFVSFKDALPGGHDEVLFHRIDGRKHSELGHWSYYLSTRQYSFLKSADPSARRAKLERLQAYRGLFQEAVLQQGMPLEFSRAANMRV